MSVRRPLGSIKYVQEQLIDMLAPAESFIASGGHRIVCSWVGDERAVKSLILVAEGGDWGIWFGFSSRRLRDALAFCGMRNAKKTDYSKAGPRNMAFSVCFVTNGKSNIEHANTDNERISIIVDEFSQMPTWEDSDSVEDYAISFGHPSCTASVYTARPNQNPTRGLGMGVVAQKLRGVDDEEILASLRRASALSSAVHQEWVLKQGSDKLDFINANREHLDNWLRAREAGYPADAPQSADAAPVARGIGPPSVSTAKAREEPAGDALAGASQAEVFDRVRRGLKPAEAFVAAEGAQLVCSWRGPSRDVRSLIVTRSSEGWFIQIGYDSRRLRDLWALWTWSSGRRGLSLDGIDEAGLTFSVTFGAFVGDNPDTLSLDAFIRGIGDAMNELHAWTDDASVEALAARYKLPSGLVWITHYDTPFPDTSFVEAAVLAQKLAGKSGKTILGALRRKTARTPDRKHVEKVLQLAEDISAWYDRSRDEISAWLAQRAFAYPE